MGALVKAKKGAIREKRREKGLTQKKLQTILRKRVSESTLRKIEKSIPVKICHFLPLAAALDCDVEDLLDTQNQSHLQETLVKQAKLQIPRGTVRMQMEFKIEYIWRLIERDLKVQGIENSCITSLQINSNRAVVSIEIGKKQ